jgi:very-short-patch-repair endonuclease
MYNKEWHKEYYLKNKEKILSYENLKYHDTHDIKPRRFSEEEFQQRLKENYGDKFETLTPYFDSKSEIKVKCKVCGYEWVTLGGRLLRGHGCKQCSILSRTKNKDKFLKEFIDKFGYECELVSKYKNGKTKIKVKCKTCGNIKEIRPDHLLHSKCGCSFCANKKRGVDSRKSHDNFVNGVFNKFGDKYEVIGQYVKANVKIDIKCNVCNNIWKITPYSLLDGHGCPNCKQSKGEVIIKQYLDNNNINYNQQYVFKGCVNKYVLHFDFYLPDYNTCIECDGRQHFKAIDYFGGEDGLKYMKNNDDIKNNYCKDNNIKIIRIPYTQINKINNILNKVLI